MRGPFEKYGKTLARLCAEEATTATLRANRPRRLLAREQRDGEKTGACIVAHCGNDCVPWDLTVLKLHEEVKRNSETYGGTYRTAAVTARRAVRWPAQYQLGKARTSSKPTLILRHGCEGRQKYTQQISHQRPTRPAPSLVQRALDHGPRG